MVATAVLLLCPLAVRLISAMSDFAPPGKLPSFVLMPDDAARRMLDDALSRLSPVQRQVVSMRLQGVSDLDRIAIRLGLPLDTVRVSLAFAVARLRMLLSDTPLEKQRDDWLQRCHTLLAGSASPADSPASGVDGRLLEAESTKLVGNSGGADATQSARRQSLRPPLLVALALLAVIAFGIWFWRVGLDERAAATRAIENAGPQRMPALDGPEAPLTAPDFELVLLRQQHEGLLENLDFYVWLIEQEALQ